MQPYSLVDEGVQKRKPLGISAPRTPGVVHEVSERGAEESRWNEATRAVSADMLGHGGGNTIGGHLTRSCPYIGIHPATSFGE